MIGFGGAPAAALLIYHLPGMLRLSGFLLNIFRREFQEPSVHIQRLVRLFHKVRRTSLWSLGEERRSGIVS